MIEDLGPGGALPQPPVGEEGPARAPSRDEAAPLVTSRNNSDISPFRLPKAYIQACGKGTLALYYGDRVDFGALSCGSWSCPHCRKRLAAQLLDRIRRGMESRPHVQRHLVTLTIDPSRFGAVRIGTSIWPDGRETALWSEPTSAQFAEASAAMSAEWDTVNDRLRLRARRAGLDRPEYFRVIELHRNGWPHYHVVYENLVGEVDWSLGRVDVRPVDLDGAVGEVAPYLICNERKGAGTKAYQFAANALPAGFRLHSSSRGFLADAEEPDGPTPTHSVAVRGHFTGHHASVRALGGESRLALHAPADLEHVPPSKSVATGDAAVVYYVGLVDHAMLHADPRWLRPLLDVMSSPDEDG